MALDTTDPGSHPLHRVRQERYCLCRLNGLSVPDAHVEAGFAVKTKDNWKTESNPRVKRRLAWLRNQVADTVVNANAVTRSEIIESIRDTRRLAKKGTPILSKDGSDTGHSKPDLSASNRSDEILAKMHGFMLDVTLKEDLDAELDGKDPKELKAFVLSLLEQLDPNMRKQLMSEVEVADEDDSEGHTIQ
jgi:hypothetical protein